MRSKYLVQGAVIAAVYTAVTLLLMPLSYGVMQIRVSEALTVLPALTPAAIPGLFVGCLVPICGALRCDRMVWEARRPCSNRFVQIAKELSPAASGFGKRTYNRSMLYYVYAVRSFWACIFWVALGEAIACYVIGFPLLKYLSKRSSIFR